MNKERVNSSLCRILEAIWLAETFATFDENSLSDAVGDGSALIMVGAMRKELERRAVEAMDATEDLEREIGHLPSFEREREYLARKEAEKHEHD